MKTTSQEASAPEISAHFFIAGRDFDPHSVTTILGVEPTEVWRQERQELLSRRDLPTVCWKLGFKKQPFMSIDDAVGRVLGDIWPLRQRVLQWSEANSSQVGIECSVSIFEDRPVYELSAITIARLAELRCEFLLDIFDYTEAESG